MLVIQAMYVPLRNKFWENSEMEGVILHCPYIFAESTLKFKLCTLVSNSVSYLDSTENFSFFFQNWFLRLLVFHIYWEFSISIETTLIIYDNRSFWHYKGHLKGYIIQILTSSLKKLQHSYLMITFLLTPFWESFGSIKIVQWATYENTPCFWNIVVNTMVQELLELCILLAANKISHLNLLASTSNVATQMAATIFSVILLVYHQASP